MAKRSPSRFLDQESFFGAIAHAVYAHSMLGFLCDVEYPTIEHEFIFAAKEALPEEFEALREIVLENFFTDDESIVECENYIRKKFDVGLEIFSLSRRSAQELCVVKDSVSVIKQYFLRKEDILDIAGYASLAHRIFGENDDLEISDSKDPEIRALTAVFAILGILLHELSVHEELISLCEEYVMKEYQLPIPFHLF